MTIIYLMLLTLFLVTGIKICRVKVNNRYQHELSPRLILIISYYMYSVAMPISRLCFDSAQTDYDVEYMMMQILGALGILIGLYCSKYYHRFTKNKNSKQAPQIFLTLPAIIIMSIAVGIVMFGSIKALDWNLSAILGQRIYESSIQTGTQEQTLFGAILWVLAISSTVLAFIGAHNTKDNKLIRLTLLLAGVFSIFFLLRGERLMAGMMILPLIGAHFFSKPVNIKKVLFSCLCLFFVLYIVGLVRNVGFALLADMPINTEMFDPLTQEFGANYRVFTIWKEMGQDNSLLLGKGYTIDVLYNLLPRFFWPDRPVTVATQFAMDYYGVSNANDLTSAWGFSPIVEALINFGRLGIVPVFALFSFLVVLLESWFKPQGAWGVSCYAFMIPIVINWNRMDMAITLKMFIIYVVVSKLFATIMYSRKRTILNAFGN